ncbi:MAG: helix-turn-helix transcriptional regulator, partial [Flavobacteriaceae bacterium]|nr:helix-turn-helix transcriptional regulator [Flavobacteriaceae bacterium]
HLKGFTQEDLANQLCISQSAYARLENRETYSWAAHLEKLCEIFEVRPEEIVTQDNVIINNAQTGGSSNNAFIINQLSEKLLAQYENRLKELEDLIKIIKPNP